jgi:hypothetical protein
MGSAVIHAVRFALAARRGLHGVLSEIRPLARLGGLMRHDCMAGA